MVKTKTKDKYYLGAPMTGIENHNKHRLLEFKYLWENEGYEIVCPADFFDGKEPDENTARRRAVKELSDCYAIIVLPEWVYYPNSFVNDEMALAKRLGMPVYDALSYSDPRLLIEIHE